MKQRAMLSLRPTPIRPSGKTFTGVHREKRARAGDAEFSRGSALALEQRLRLLPVFRPLREADTQAGSGPQEGDLSALGARLFRSLCGRRFRTHESLSRVADVTRRRVSGSR